MVASDGTMRRFADILNVPRQSPAIIEITALGAARLAGHEDQGPEGRGTADAT